MNPYGFPAMQFLTTWTEQGDSPGPHGPCTLTAATETTPMRISFTPAVRPKGSPWDNVYVLQRHHIQNWTWLAYFVTVFFPQQQDIDDCTAFELDVQMNLGNAVINWGWQFLIGTGVRIWNKSAHSWLGPVLPPGAAAFSPGVEKHILCAFSHDAERDVRYDGIAVDGTWYPLNQTYPTIPEKQNPYLNNAVQLDSKGKGAPVNLMLNECSLVGY